MNSQPIIFITQGGTVDAANFEEMHGFAEMHSRVRV